MITHISSDDGMTLNWGLAYGLFCGPFVLLALSGLLVKPNVLKLYSWVSWFFVMAGAALIITNQALYVLPTLAWLLLALSAIALFASVLYRLVSTLQSRRSTT